MLIIITVLVHLSNLRYFIHDLLVITLSRSLTFKQTLAKIAIISYVRNLNREKCNQVEKVRIVVSNCSRYPTDLSIKKKKKRKKKKVL